MNKIFHTILLGALLLNTVPSFSLSTELRSLTHWINNNRLKTIGLILTTAVAGTICFGFYKILLEKASQKQKEKNDQGLQQDYQSKRLIQNMPPASLWEKFAQGLEIAPRAMQKSFIEDCKKHAQENEKIPNHITNNDTVRIATYNVHMWTDTYKEKNNLEAILDTIKSINADILVLQEVHLFDEKRILESFQKYGYEYIDKAQMNIMAGNFYGNMVLSKYPFAEKPTVKTYTVDTCGDRRCYVKATIKLPHDKKIIVYGTHLDVYDTTEKKRVHEVIELLEDIQGAKENCIIAADFNAVRKADYQYLVKGKKVWDMLNENNKKRTGIPTQTHALETLERHGFKDSFSKNNQQGPHYTVWSGTTVDFIYLNPAWNLPINGSYVYYSCASDHVPILMDINIK